MKRTLLTICMLLLVCQGLFAQGRVTTRKYRFSDFGDKVTKIVLTGDPALDATLGEDIVRSWNASAFEFCSMADFNAVKTQENYYWLLRTEAEGVEFLTLMKGGPAAAEGIDKSLEVISLPLRGAGNEGGRELLYLDALICGIQSFAKAAALSERTAYSPNDFFNENFTRYGRMKRIYLLEEDIAPQVKQADRSRYLDEDIIVCDEDRADTAFMEGEYNALVSYVVCPAQAGNGAYCYKLFIEAGTNTIYYIRRHKLGRRTGPGFLTEDFKRIARLR